MTFIKGLVDPSQKSNEKPHNPWVCIDKKKGYIVSAHCTCLAGLGEACSHIAAVLFAIEAVNQQGINSAPTCTMVKSVWSTYYKEKVVPARANNLDFTHPRHGQPRKKRRSIRRAHEG